MIILGQFFSVLIGNIVARWMVEGEADGYFSYFHYILNICCDTHQNCLQEGMKGSVLLF